jgi:pyruvate kinase
MNILSPFRRTKIIATLGPATRERAALVRLLQAGVDVVRINFSHGTEAEQLAQIQLVHECAQEIGREVAVLADLQGPKIRISRFQQQQVSLQVGQDFTLDADLNKDAGDEHTVGIDYKELPRDVAPGDRLFLDDGRISMIVQAIVGNKIQTKVEVGGTLSNNKGINREGGGLSAKALTDKDKRDLITAVKANADFIAVSFPRCAQDILYAKQLIREANGQSAVIAKIERVEAVAAMDEIIQASDGVMVARGDLGVEIGDAELPAVQKALIKRARTFNKPVITATQMMESMIHNDIPTRAEVFDVANAVLDYTDAVMLSAETATGKHPNLVVEKMVHIIVGAEKDPSTKRSRHRVECQFEYIDEAIAMATMYTANHLEVKAIIALTESGASPLWMSRIRTPIPIYGLSRHSETRRKMMLYHGVFPIPFDVLKETRDTVNQAAIDVLKKSGLVHSNDRVILTKGDLEGIHGGTNAMKIMIVP